MRLRGAAIRLACVPRVRLLSGKPSLLDVPLNAALPDARWGPPAGAELFGATVRVTELRNGVRVASQPSLEPVACVGVALNGGQLLESRASGTVGMAAALRRMWLSATAARSAQDTQALLEEVGAAVVRSEPKVRDSIYVGAELLAPQSDVFLGLLSESLTHPSFTLEDLEFQKTSLRFEREDLEKKPDKRIEEMLFAAAYPNDALGHHSVPELADIDAITLPGLQRFHAQHVTSDNVVVAGHGVDHDDLCRSAEKHLGQLERAPTPPVLSQASYVGGDLQVYLEDLPKPLEQTLLDDQDDPRITIAFRGPGVTDEDHYCLTILNCLMGGGKSFSTGGPGKGIFTRLFARVLMRYGFCHNVKVRSSMQAFATVR